MKPGTVVFHKPWWPLFIFIRTRRGVGQRGKAIVFNLHKWEISISRIHYSNSLYRLGEWLKRNSDKL